MKISQTIIKDYLAYSKGEECAEVLISKHIKKDFPKVDSDTMRLGRYFEYILTNVPSNYHPEGEEAEYKKTAKTKTVEDMLEPYKLATKKAKKLKDLFLRSGIEIIEAQTYKENGDLNGNIDIIADFRGEYVVIDLKYSGLIDNRWDKFGWQWTPEQKEYNAIQAVQYKLLTGYDVLFCVAGSGKKDEFRLFRVVLSENTVENHKMLAERAKTDLELMEALGSGQNYPSFNKCNSCPLKKTCKDAKSTLQVEFIEI